MATPERTDPPERPARPRQVLVTGSAGRSSAAAMIAALLHAAGQSVIHLGANFLHSPLERLTINGVPLTTEQAAALSADRAAKEEAGTLPVEDLLRHVLDVEAPDWVVLSGLPAGDGHMELVCFSPILTGKANAADLTRAICRDLPQPPRAVCAPQRESVLEILRQQYPELQEVAQLCRLSRGRSDLDGQEFRLRTPQQEYRLTLSVLGQFQVENAATAILGVESLTSLGVELTTDAARRALAELRLPGRLEVIKRRPLVIVDACSHTGSLIRVAEALRGLVGGRRTVVVLDPGPDLDAAAAVDILLPLRPEILAVGPHHGLTEACYELGCPLQIAPTVTAATDWALSAAGQGDAILVTGSRPAVAAARAFILGLMPAAPA